MAVSVNGGSISVGVLIRSYKTGPTNCLGSISRPLIFGNSCIADRNLILLHPKPESSGTGCLRSATCAAAACSSFAIDGCDETSRGMAARVQNVRKESSWELKGPYALFIILAGLSPFFCVAFGMALISGTPEPALIVLHRCST